MNAPWKPPSIPAAPPELEALPGLREVRTKDGAGRVITTFEGRPSAWLRQFGCNPKRVTGIKTSLESPMSDKFEDTSIFRRFKATGGVPDAFADSTEATIAFDEVLTPLGLRAPMRAPNGNVRGALWARRTEAHQSL
jgi:hypothetical protein